MPGPTQRLHSGLLAWQSPSGVTLSLPAGHLADRFSRKHIILWSQVFSALMSLALALVSWKHLSIPQIAPLREGNRALAALAAIFERHHPMFHSMTRQSR